MATSVWDTPEWIWMNGKLTPWNECQVHITSGYAQRGASIFEGIRIYAVGHSRTHVALGLTAHLDRLENTWHSLSLPKSHTNQAIRQGIVELLSRRGPGDYYCRVTRYLDVRKPEGGQDGDGSFVVIYKQTPLLGKPVACILSPWRRTSFGLPAQMKMGGHYFMFGWLRQQARQMGADDAILLNDRDLVSEATGTAVMVFIDGQLVTPPVSDGALPSITARFVLSLASQLGIRTAVRSVHRNELPHAQAILLAGSLDELRPVTALDGLELPDVLKLRPIADLFDAFDAVCRGKRDHAYGERIESH